MNGPKYYYLERVIVIVSGVIASRAFDIKFDTAVHVYAAEAATI